MIQVFFSILMSRAASNMAICLFTFLMGSLVKLMEKSGGTRAFCNWFSKFIKGRKMTLMIGLFVSSFLFLDDYFNIITSSAIMHAIFERNNISKPKAAYQIHTLASNLCILFPITSWAAVFSGFPFASHAQTCTVVNTCRNVHLKRLRFAFAAGAATIWALFFDDLTTPAAFWAGGL